MKQILMADLTEEGSRKQMWNYFCKCKSITDAFFLRGGHSNREIQF